MEYINIQYMELFNHYTAMIKPETNITLYVNYTRIEILKIKSNKLGKIKD